MLQHQNNQTVPTITDALFLALNKWHVTPQTIISDAARAEFHNCPCILLTDTWATAEQGDMVVAHSSTRNLLMVFLLGEAPDTLLRSAEGYTTFLSTDWDITGPVTEIRLKRTQH
jgi:hypothetical protein